MDFLFFNAYIPLTMRIIRGIYKGRRFPTPKNFKARPTTDFAKEGLFNILDNNYFDFEEDKPAALDLFAGTGSIGLELASRGCRHVVSVEKNFRHWQFLQQVAHELNDGIWKPVHADVFRFCKQCNERYDLIFADPPYSLPNLRDIPDIVLGEDVHDSLLAEGGLFVLEHGKDYDFNDYPCFVEHRNYGSVNFTFFRR